MRLGYLVLFIILFLIIPFPLVRANVLPLDQQIRLNNIQRLSTSNIATILSMPADANPQSEFMNVVKWYSDQGHDVFNFYVIAPDNVTSVIQQINAIMQAINEKTGKTNWYIPQLNFDSYNSDQLIRDRLNNGQDVVRAFACPNYAFVDFSDPAQTNRYLTFFRTVVSGLKSSPLHEYIMGYYPVYGYYGETGLWIGNDLADCNGVNNEFPNNSTYSYMNISTGYSISMLAQFKTWYNQKKTEGIIPASGVDTLVANLQTDAANKSTWPLPSGSAYSDQAKLYAYFLMFRKEKQRTFNGQIVNAIRSEDSTKAIEGNCYLPIDYPQIANGWTDFPGTDFCSAQLGVAVYSTGRLLQDTDYVGLFDYSGVDGSMNTPDWFADNVRRIVKLGGNTRTFDRPMYRQNGVASAVIQANSEKPALVSNQTPHNGEIAIFVPTYSRGLLPPSGKTFEAARLTDIRSLVMILNSMNVSYEFISEDELLDIPRLNKYKLLIIHYKNLFATLFPGPWNALLNAKGGIIAGDDPSGQIPEDFLRTAVQNLILNTPDRCANVCTTADPSYLLNAQCMKTCPVPLFPLPIPGDLNNDRKVNVTDLRTALSQSPLSIFTYNLVVGNYGRP